MSSLQEMLKSREKNGYTLKESTIDMYIKNLRTLCKKMNILVKGVDDSVFDLDALSNHHKVFASLKKPNGDELAPNTKKNLLNGLISVLTVVDSEKYDSNIKEFQKVAVQLGEGISKEQKKNVKSKKELENWCTLEDLQKCCDWWKQECQLTLDSKVECMEQQDMVNQYVASLLYSGHTPVTRREIHNTKVISKAEYDKLEEKKGNYIVLGKAKSFLSINDYKTADKKIDEHNVHGENVIKIPKPIALELMRCMKASYNPKLLFPKRSNIETHMTPDELGKLVTKCFKRIKKNLTITIIRKIFVTSLNDQKLTYEQREKIAYQMMSSVPMQLKVYNTFLDGPIEDVLDVETEE